MMNEKKLEYKNVTQAALPLQFATPVPRAYTTAVLLA